MILNDTTLLENEALITYNKEKGKEWKNLLEFPISIGPVPHVYHHTQYTAFLLCQSKNFFLFAFLFCFGVTFK